MYLLYSSWVLGVGRLVRGGVKRILFFSHLLFMPDWNTIQKIQPSYNSNKEISFVVHLIRKFKHFMNREQLLFDVFIFMLFKV